MILVGSQRAGGGNLATHLLKLDDNDHVTVVELRGFIGTTLREAFDEARALSKATKAKQYLFSLSLNPPPEADVDIDDLTAAADRAEARLGLTGQPRAVVIHEKLGRRHAHVVWGRIDAKALKAINHPFFKTRLAELSRELFLDHGWELPKGHRTNDWKNPLNFTLDDWQQARRLDLDPREIKQAFQEAWKRSDDIRSFSHALEEVGYFLARGDRRGFVALDIKGRPFSVPRWLGLKTKEVESRLGDPSALPGVEEVKAATDARMARSIAATISNHEADQARALAPLLAERGVMVSAHRAERERLREGQDARWKAEARARAERIRSGLRGVLDFLTGRARAIRADNEREALACQRRDAAQADALYQDQKRERRALQDRLDDLARRQRHERRLNARRIAVLLRRADPDSPSLPTQTRMFGRDQRPKRGPSLSR